MTMFEYSKAILSKVSFDEELLEKEPGKAIRNIHFDERPALIEWCRKELGKKCEQMVSKRPQIFNN